VQERLALKNASRERLRLVWLSTCAAAATLLLFVGYRVFAAQQAITYQVVGANLTDSGVVTGGPESRVQFSDGSLVTLDEGTQTRIGEVGPHGGLLHLDKGWARVSIAKKPKANWAVQAGPYTVRVTGTAFDVNWSVSEQRFEIAMRTGSVVITGPLTPNGVALRAGERMIADRKLVVEKPGTELIARGDKQFPNSAAADSAGAAIISPESLPTESDSANESHAKKAEAPRGASWRQLVASGNFNTVIEEALRRGLGRTLASASLEDLSALADAARYARRTDIGREALLAQRQRFPGSREGREAAFFLGSVYEGTGAALDWYERYLQENPRGSYVSQALGRKLVLMYDQRRVSDAKKTAEQYMAKYPNGPYASTARKVLAEAKSPVPAVSTNASSRPRR
jgi:TolA-binding protein